jgi:hypothetical protein
VVDPRGEELGVAAVLDSAVRRGVFTAGQLFNGMRRFTRFRWPVPGAASIQTALGRR